MIPPRFNPGDRLGAGALNAIMAELRRLGSIRGVAPVRVSSGPEGFCIGVDVDEVWWIKITASGGDGTYSWKRQVAGSIVGTWADSPGGEQGTVAVPPSTPAFDPAYELNANPLVPLNSVVEAWRGLTDNALHFSLGKCT